MYRMQLLDKRTTGMHWQAHKTGMRHFHKYKERGQRVPVAVVLGGDPALTYAATAPLPDGVDELLLAGFLRRRAVELVRVQDAADRGAGRRRLRARGLRRSDGAAHRRGAVRRSHRLLHAARQVPGVPRHLRHAAQATPIYPATVVGRPPMEDAWLGKATERLFLPLLRMMLPELVDYNLPVEGVFHNMAIVAIDKQYPWHGRKIMHALWGMGQLMFTKCVVVVDKDVNVHDVAEVALARAQQHRSQARRHDLRRAVRRARPRVVLGRLRRQDGRRRHRQVEGRGLRARLAGGGDHGARDRGARRPLLARAGSIGDERA